MYVVIGCGGLLIITFVLSAASKVRSRAAFAEFVTATRQLLAMPAVPAAPVAVGVAAAESVLPLLVFALPVAGFPLSAVLLSAFGGAVTRAVRRGVRQPCRCFGASAAPLGYRHAVRAAVLCAVALLGTVAAVAGGVRTGAGLLTTVQAGGAALALFAAAMCAVLIVRLDDLVDLARAPGGGARR